MAVPVGDPTGKEMAHLKGLSKVWTLYRYMDRIKETY